VRIREEQINALDASNAARFEEEMSRHLHQFSPAHCAAIQETGVREVIRRSLKSAQSYGFTFLGPVRLYTELTFLLGIAFDTDPMASWVQPILTTGSTKDQMDRAARLHSETLRFAAATGGPGNEYAKSAFRRARRLKYEDYRLPPGDFEAACLKRLRLGYPEKFDFVGADGVGEVVRKAAAAAGELGVTSEAGIGFLSAMAFAVGHGFASDPLLPWVERTLQNEALGDANKRVERLYAKSMTYLDEVLANFA